MFGVSSTSKEALSKIVEEIFDNIALQFIGDIPKLQNKKRLVISSEPNLGLAHLFVQAMKNRTPNDLEKDVLKSLLTSSYGYIESLKNKTTSNIAERIDGLAREAKLQDRKLSREEVQAVIAEEFKRAKAAMATIAEAESSKFKTLGTAIDITRVSASVGDDDPTIFFVVIKDNVTCLEENENVITTKGIVKVGNLKIGDILKNPSTPSQRGGNKVLAIEKKIKETIELDFGNQKITCTRDHPLLVRFGKVLCFMEADRITKEHDVVLMDEIKTKGQFKMISRAKTARDFMKNLGYTDAWDFWRENIDEMINIAKKTGSRIPIMKKYGIDVPMWNRYVKHILTGYNSTIKFVGGCPGNNFNIEYITNKSRNLKIKRKEKYELLGADDWFVREIKNGKNCSTIAKEQDLSVSFLRSKIKILGLLSFVRAKGGRANWNKNGDFLISLGKKRGTPHFVSLSKPEKLVGEGLSKAFLDLKTNFTIGNIKVDFCIPSEKLAIEYDGSGHNLLDKIAGNKTNRITNKKDYARDKFLKESGYRIFRIKASKDKFDINSIINSIHKFLSSKKSFDIWQN